MRTRAAVVVGDWHLASVTSAALLKSGYCVVGFDFDTAGNQRLRKISGTAAEPEIANVIRTAMKEKRYRVVDDEVEFVTAVREADIIFVSYDSRTTLDGNHDDDRTSDACETILGVEGRNCAVVVSSQVRAGTCDNILAAAGFPDTSQDLVHIPENLRLGTALQDFLSPHRLVTGCNADALPGEVRYFISFLNVEIETHVRLVEAEMVKHGTNAYLAMCISFANDLATVARHLNGDPHKVLAAVQADHRIGTKAPLRPGEAYSGATLQRDVTALERLGAAAGRDGLFGAISRSNAVHALGPVAILDRALEGLEGRRIGLLGLTYKPDTSTVRDSPSVRLARELLNGGSSVAAFDPNAEALDEGNIERYNNVADAVCDVDCVVVFTDHPEFHRIDFSHLTARNKLLLDLRPINAVKLQAEGWKILDCWQRR